MATVIGPTPPGTGVMNDASFLTSSKSTSPQSFPSKRLMPTSITTAPFFIHSFSKYAIFGKCHLFKLTKNMDQLAEQVVLQYNNCGAFGANGRLSVDAPGLHEICRQKNVSRCEFCFTRRVCRGERYSKHILFKDIYLCIYVWYHEIASNCTALYAAVFFGDYYEYRVASLY